MPKYSAVIMVTVSQFEANDDEHADDISSIFTKKILDAHLSESSDIRIQVDTFISEDENS